MRKETGTWDIHGESYLISVLESGTPVSIIVPDSVATDPEDYEKSQWKHGDVVEVTYVPQKKSGVRKAKKIKKM